MHQSGRLAGFETHSPDVFASAMAPVAPGIRVQPIRGSECAVKVKLGELPGIGLFRVGAANLWVRRQSERYIGVTIPERGAIECVDRGQADEYDVSSAHVLAANRPFDLRVRVPTPMLVANFDADMLKRSGKRLNDGKTIRDLGDNHRFTLTDRAGSSFRRILQFVLGEMDRSGSVMRSPEALAATADLLRDSLLQVDALDASSSRPGKHGDWLALVNRAEDFIDANLQRPIAISELASVCGVNASTLRRAFQRKYGYGPHAFMKLHRLERVRDALATAEPAATVTDIATRHGFFHLSQFAADYRRQFGELPSKTLRVSQGRTD